MPIQTKCPGCGQSYAVSEKLAGKRTRCKKCGGIVTIPAGSAPSATPPASSPPALPSRPELPSPNAAASPPGFLAPATLQPVKCTSRRRIPKAVWYVGGGVAGLVLLGVMGGLLVKLLSGGGEFSVNGPGQDGAGAGHPPGVLAALPEGKNPLVAIPLSRSQSGDARYSTTTSPCAVLGKQLWNLRLGKLCLNLEKLIDDDDFTFSATPDGKLFALFDDSRPVVEVRTVSQGQIVRVLQADFPGGGEPLAMGFRGADEIAVFWRAEKHDQSDRGISYKIATGEKTAEILVRSHEARFSPSGDRFACKADDGLRIGDFRQGGPATRKLAGPPASEFGFSGSLPAISPDGKYAINATGTKKHTFVLWNTATGEVISRRAVSPIVWADGDRSLRWLPDSRSVLVGGRSLVDRDSGRLLWSITDTGKSGSESPVHVLGPSHLLCEVEDRDMHNWLVSVEIPWDKINAAAAGVVAARATVKPGQAIDLKIAVSGVAGDPDASRREIAAIVAERLEREGISIQAGAPVAMYVALNERRGDMLEVVEKSGFGSRGSERRTGEKVQQSRATVEIALKQGDDAAPLWEYAFDANGGSVVYGEATGDGLRKQMLQRIAVKLAHMPTPYFIGADGKKLPIFSQFRDTQRHMSKSFTASGATPGGLPLKAAGLQTTSLPPAPEVKFSAPPGSPSQKREPSPYARPAFAANFKPTVAIPLPVKSTLLYPSSNCDVVMAGGQVWDIAAGRRLVKYSRELPRRYTRSRGGDLHKNCFLSPDGAYLVASVGSSGQRAPLEIWSARRGGLTHTVNAKQDHAEIRWGAFRNGTELVLITERWEDNTGASIQFLNAASGEMTRRIPLQGVGSLLSAQAALSPNGSRLALGYQGLREIDLGSDVAAARFFTAPQDESGSAAEIVGLAYSPDGALLAGVGYDNSLFRLFLWNPQTGALVSDRLCPSGSDASLQSFFGDYPGPLLRWLPDGSGLLVAGSALVDVPSGRVIWTLDRETATGSDPQVVGVLDNTQLLVSVDDPHVGRWLVNAPIPWQAIQQGAQIAAGEGAALRPGDKVSVEMALGPLPATDAGGRNMVGAAVAARLANDGLQVATGQPVRLFVRHDDAVTQRASNTSRFGRTAARTVTSRRTEYEVGWRRASGEVLWRQKMVSVTASSSASQRHASGAGRSRLDRRTTDFIRWLRTVPWPYAVGQNAGQPCMLPVASDFPASLDGVALPQEARGAGAAAKALARAPNLHLPALPPMPARQAGPNLATGRRAAPGVGRTTTSDPYAARKATYKLRPWERYALPLSGYRPKVSIEFDGFSHSLGFAWTTPRFALLGAEVYDLKAGKRLGQIQELSKNRSEWLAVSPDGKLAASQDTSNRNLVNIWSVETGKRLREVDGGQARARLRWMGFRNENELVLVWSPWLSSNDSACQVWNATTGDGVLAFGPEAGSTGFGEGDFTLSADGARLAYQDHSTAKNQTVTRPGLLVRDLATGGKKTIAYKSPKGGVEDLVGLAFSPDGKTILAASQSFSSTLQLIVWQSRTDAQRRQYPFTVSTTSASEPWLLQWLPDGSGYMIGANILIDHKSGRALWVLQHGSVDDASRYPWRFLENDQLLICEDSSGKRRLVSVPVPWKDIRASQAAMNSGRPAFLKPGDTVGVDVSIPKSLADDPAGGAGSPLYQALGLAAAERLKIEGFKIDSKAPIRFYVRYRPGGGLTTDARPGASETAGEAVSRIDAMREVEIGWRLGNEVLWNTAPAYPISKLLQSADQSGAPRSAQYIISGFTRSVLSKIILPYYIPREKNLGMLPIYSRN